MDNKELIRYCPGCGSIGEVEATYRNCCPDGQLAFKVPHNFARACQATFRALIDSPATSLAPAAVNAVDEQINLLRDALYCMLQQFTGTPSTLADSEARGKAHAALKATAVKAAPAVVQMTDESVRAAGGIVHKDGNIFFTNIDKLNAAILSASGVQQ